MMPCIRHIKQTLHLSLRCTLLGDYGRHTSFRRDQIGWLIAIISGAFFLLLAIQFYWTRQSILSAHQQFEQNVQKAYHTLNSDLEKQEAAFYFRQGMGAGHRQMMIWHEKLDSMRTQIKEGMVSSMDCVIVNKYPNNRVRFQQRIKFENNGKNEDVIVEFDVQDSGSVESRIDESIDRKSRQLEHIFIEMMTSSDDSLLEHRLGLDNLEELIASALQKNGVNTPFEYQLVRHTFFGNQVVQQSAALTDIPHTYRGIILPGLLGGGKNELLLSFPERHLFIARRVWLMLISSVGLILVLIYAFYYSISSLMKQRKVAEMKNDFISNMTHELKTPITSINLACETIADPQFPFTRDSVSTYIKVISDENNRLKTLVNNVLDSSFADSDKLSLRLESVNIVVLTQQVVDRFSMILQNVNGRITVDQQLENPMVVADQFHLSNAIFNLVDNAIKYTRTTPDIHIHLQMDKHLRIQVSDNGIGISKAEQKNIFEKFHRVSTGNVHDVKGFGLGLSYVKRVVEMHKGTISVQSELGKGTTFTIELPQ